jgi:hypothetical protein
MMAVGHSQVVARFPPTMGDAVSDTGSLPGRLSQPGESKPMAAVASRIAKDRRQGINTPSLFS